MLLFIFVKFAEEGSVLVVDVGTLTLAPSLLPVRPPDKKEKISGKHIKYWIIFYILFCLVTIWSMHGWYYSQAHDCLMWLVYVRKIIPSFCLGVKVMHRSRVCYLTTLEVKLPGVEIPPEWDLLQTCASRQLADNGTRRKKLWFGFPLW